MVAAEHERHDVRANDRLELLGDLHRRPFGIAGRHREVAGVDDRQCAEDVDPMNRMPPAQQHGRIADGGRSEARAWAHRGGRVERDAAHGHVDIDEVVEHVGAARERSDAGVAGLLAGVRRSVSGRHRPRNPRLVAC